jgi:hypothetical protein
MPSGMLWGGLGPGASTQLGGRRRRRALPCRAAADTALRPATVQVHYVPFYTYSEGGARSCRAASRRGCWGAVGTAVRGVLARGRGRTLLLHPHSPPPP